MNKEVLKGYKRRIIDSEEIKWRIIKIEQKTGGDDAVDCPYTECVNKILKKTIETSNKGIGSVSVDVMRLGAENSLLVHEKLMWM